MSNKKSNKGLVVFIVILVLVVGGAVAALCVNGLEAISSGFSYSGSFGSSKNEKSVKTKTNGKPYIAVLHVEGTIQPAGTTYNQEWILSKIKKFKEDEKNKAIILFINSPGGTVYDSDETYLALQDYKTTGKKVYAYMGSLAASGGYYIACAADKIYANRNTLTGSIGVIAGQFIDITEFLEDHGIYYETIHAGRNKNMGNYNEPVTEEQEEIMQSIADECYEQFTLIVSSSRNIKYSELLPLCDGRIYTAKQALANGLIDGIGSWENLVSDIEEEVPELEGVNTVHFSYEKQQTIFEKMMSSAVRPAKTESIEGIPSALWEQMNMKGPLYLYK